MTIKHKIRSIKISKISIASKALTCRILFKIESFCFVWAKLKETQNNFGINMKNEYPLFAT